MKSICILVSLLFSIAVSVNSQQLTYQKFIGGTSFNDIYNFRDMVELPEKGVYIFGFKNDFSLPFDTVSDRIIFVDSLGTVSPLTMLYTHPNNYSLLKTVKSLANHRKNLVCVGAAGDTIGYAGAVEYDTSGLIVRNICFNIASSAAQPPNYIFFDLYQCNDNGYLFTGRGDLSTHAVLIKVDSNLNYQWGREYKKNSRIYFEKTIQLHDGNFLVAGSSEVYINGNYYNRVMLMKTDTAGNILWNKIYNGGVVFGYAWDVTELPNGDVLACGDVNDSSGLATAFVMRCDTGGNVVWSEKFLFPAYMFTNLTALADGDIVLSGGCHSGFFDASLLVKLDSTGQQKWGRFLYDGDFNRKMLPLSDGGFALMSNNYTTLTKTDSMGYAGCLQDTVTLPHSPGLSWIADSIVADTLLVTTVSLQLLTAPGTVIADTNFCIGYTSIPSLNVNNNMLRLVIYPNPAQQKITLQLNSKQPIQILISDVAGKMVMQQNLPHQNREVNISLLQAGIYFIEASDGKQMHRGIFVKE